LYLVTATAIVATPNELTRQTTPIQVGPHFEAECDLIQWLCGWLIVAAVLALEKNDGTHPGLSASLMVCVLLLVLLVVGLAFAPNQRVLAHFRGASVTPELSGAAVAPDLTGESEGEGDRDAPVAADGAEAVVAVDEQPRGHVAAPAEEMVPNEAVERPQGAREQAAVPEPALLRRPASEPAFPRQPMGAPFPAGGAPFYPNSQTAMAGPELGVRGGQAQGHGGGHGDSSGGGDGGGGGVSGVSGGGGPFTTRSTQPYQQPWSPPAQHPHQSVYQMGAGQVGGVGYSSSGQVTAAGSVPPHGQQPSAPYRAGETPFDASSQTAMAWSELGGQAQGHGGQNHNQGYGGAQGHSNQNQTPQGNGGQAQGHGGQSQANSRLGFAGFLRKLSSGWE
jgi:uncharacterized membrane protein YgcG